MTSFFPYSKKFEYFFTENGEKVTYEKNQHLVWKKDECDWVFFLCEGLVRASFSFSDEAPRIIGFFAPGAVFAQSGSFVSEYDGTLSYTAELPSSVLRVRKSVFLSHLKSDLGFMNEYLDMTLRHQLLLIDRIVYQGEKGLRAKCVRWLLFMEKYYGKTIGNQCEITIPLTQETVANFLHATRESINGILREMEIEKIIELSTKRIVITDRAKLRQELL